MTPYYQTKNATLYHGDAREILDTLPPDSLDLLATDPPYGQEWQSNFRKTLFEPIEGDTRNNRHMVVETLKQAVRPLRKGRHVYVFGFTPKELSELLQLGGTADIVWNKSMIGPGDLSSPWAPQHERITFGVHNDSQANRSDGAGNLSARLRRGTVLTVPRPNSRGVNRHPTEKPLPLMQQLIESSTLPGETVLDPFAGSGSTLVAAILTGRRAIGIEIHEPYAATTAARLRRAETLTNQYETI